MAEKFLDKHGTSTLWEKIKTKFVQKDGDKVLSDNNYSNVEKVKLEGIEDGANNYSLPTASDAVLGGVKVGTGLEVDENGVMSATGLTEVEWDDVENKPNTVAGYGITDAATKDELEEVKESVSKLYHYCGSVATYDDLLAIEDPNEGDVYDVEDTGKDYAWVAAKPGKEGFWDDLGGKFEIESISDEEIEIITGSPTTTEALDYILKNGSSAELDADIALVSQYQLTSDFELDMNGHELSSEINKPLFIVDGSVLTLKGGEVNVSNRVAEAINGGKIIIESGEYNSGDVGFTAAGEGSKVTFNDGFLTAVEGGAGAFDGASVEMNGGNMVISDNFTLFTNGTNGRGNNTIVLNGGRLVGNIKSAGYEACGIYIANNDTFVMNGGEVIANGGAGLCMRAGFVTINGGKIEAKVSENRPVGSTGWIGDKKTNMTQSAIIYHESADYPGKEGMSLTINDGEFIGVAHSLEILSNETTPNVVVAGGTFSPAYPET